MGSGRELEELFVYYLCSLLFYMNDSHMDSSVFLLYYISFCRLMCEINSKFKSITMRLLNVSRMSVRLPPIKSKHLSDIQLFKV